MKDENKEKDIIDSNILIGILRTLIQILYFIGWGLIWFVLLMGGVMIYIYFSWLTVAAICLVSVGLLLIFNIENIRASRHLNSLENRLKKYESKSKDNSNV